MDPESKDKKCPEIAASFCPSNDGSTLLVTNLFPQSLDQQHHIEMSESAIGNPVMDKHQTHHLTLFFSLHFRHGTCIEEIYPNEYQQQN